MKKLTLLFTCLLATLYFFTCFFAKADVNFRESQNTYNYFLNLDYSKNNVVDLYVNNSLGEDQESRGVLLSILEKYDCVAIGSAGSMKDSSSRNIEFIYAKNDLYKNLLHTKNNERIDFTNDNENRFYTSTKKSKNGIMIDLLNPLYYTYFESYPFEIHPMHHIDKDFSPTALKISNMTMDTFYSEIKGTPLEKHINSNSYDVTSTADIVHVKEPEGIQYDSNGILLICLILSLVTLSLLLMVNVVKSKKFVAITRLHGFSKIKIIRKVFAPLTIKIFITYAITQILLLLFVAGQYRAVSKDLYRIILLSILGFAIILIFLLIIIYIYLTLYRNFHELKQNKINRFTIYTNIIIKLVMSVMLIAPFVQLVPDAYSQIQKTMALQRLSKESKNLYSYDIRYTQDFSKNENIDKIKTEVSKYFTKKNDAIVFQFFDWYIQYDDSGEDYNFNIKETPVMSVNINYLKKYGTLYNEDGSVLNYSALKDPILLIPEQHKNKSEINDYKNMYGTNETLTIKNLNKPVSSVLINHVPYEPFFKNPILYVIGDDEVGKYSYTTFVPTNDIKSLYKEIKQLGYGDYITFDSIYPYITLEYNLQFNTLSTMAFLLIGYLAVYLAFVYQNIYVYLDVYHKNIMIKYLNGYSYIRRYYEIFAINLCAYIVAGIISVLILDVDLKATILYILFFSSIEILFEIYQIHKFQKHDALTSLK